MEPKPPEIRLGNEKMKRAPTTQEIADLDFYVKIFKRNPAMNEKFFLEDDSYYLERFEEGFQELCSNFKETYSLEALTAMKDLPNGLHQLFKRDRDMSPEQIGSLLSTLSEEEARYYELRTAAKKDLIPIVQILNYLKVRMPTPEHDKLKIIYMRLSRAVGMINSGKIDHTRG